MREPRGLPWQWRSRSRELLLRQDPRTLWWRALLLFGGSLVSTFCYAVTIRATIGLGPLFSFQDGVAHHLHIAIGTSVMLIGVAFVILALCFRTRPGPGTLILPFFGGWTLDLMLPHLPVIHGKVLQYVAVIVATWIMALGGAMVFRSAVGVSSYTSVMLGLRRVTGQKLAPLRLGMEFTMFVSGWLLGGAVGWGSVITGVLIGPSLQFWIRLFGGIPGESPVRTEVNVAGAGAGAGAGAVAGADPTKRGPRDDAEPSPPLVPASVLSSFDSMSESMRIQGEVV